MTYCPRCGRQNSNLVRFCKTCGTELQTIGPILPTVFFAGFWQRFAAIVIDAIVVGIVGGILSFASAGLGALSLLFLPWIYEAVLLSSERQATVGKMILGIMVTDIDARRISFGRATGRHFAKYISALILGIGFFIAAFTRKKQALHDIMADTLVINK